MKYWMKKMAMVAAVPALFLAGCDDDDDGVDLVEEAEVMVVHASPDAPGVDLLVNDVKVNNSPLTFPNNTGYLELPAGTQNIKVNAAGTTTTVINADLNLQRDKDYTVFAINTLDNIEALVLEDDLTDPASGMSHVRFVHLSPDAPAVDIAVQGGPVLFSNRAFKSATPFTPVSAGTYTLEVRPAGSTTAVLTIPNVELRSGDIYTVFARGFLSPPEGNTNTLGAQVIVNEE
ncbi:DUF4397 domain-containing protein [Pontibacter chinhatensis]|uniref:DUF4397 domain-containing protein n=1 Tax=Pontibacter chinhatensis TaxID=1436961 RepID=A0A1I2VRR4_9BACT|nr:DUF4397 domain-containing protein [Pontibacter chinhatensis]SFG92035.1 protein of unknown function [Pontibacter chinhatensis]